MKTLRQRQQETGRLLSLNGVKWRRLRAAVLEREPLCRDCWKRGRITTATDLDHADNNPRNNAEDNLVPLCHECHSRKTQADLGKRVAYGCDADGMPLDPLHPWNNGR